MHGTESGVRALRCVRTVARPGEHRGARPPPVCGEPTRVQSGLVEHTTGATPPSCDLAGLTSFCTRVGPLRGGRRRATLAHETFGGAETHAARLSPPVQIVCVEAPERAPPGALRHPALALLTCAAQDSAWGRSTAVGGSPAAAAGAYVSAHPPHLRLGRVLLPLGGLEMVSLYAFGGWVGRCVPGAPGAGGLAVVAKPRRASRVPSQLSRVFLSAPRLCACALAALLGWGSAHASHRVLARGEERRGASLSLAHRECGNTARHVPVGL